MINDQHWTQQSLGDFAYWVTSDFTAQIETKLEQDEISHCTFAKMINVTPPRVSQVLHDPGNLTVGNAVKYARALGLKVALVAYDDSDHDNTKGPISAEVFAKCWERMGRPQEFSELMDMTQSRGCWVLTKTDSAVNDRTDMNDVRLEKTAAANTYAAGAGAGGGGDRRRSA